MNKKTDINDYTESSLLFHFFGVIILFVGVVFILFLPEKTEIGLIVTLVGFIFTAVKDKDNNSRKHGPRPFRHFNNHPIGHMRKLRDRQRSRRTNDKDMSH